MTRASSRLDLGRALSLRSALRGCEACRDRKSTRTSRRRTGLRRGAAGAGERCATFHAADEDYFHDMDGGIALTPERSGTQHLDRLERRQRPLLGRHLADQPRHARLAEDDCPNPTRPAQASDNRWHYLGSSTSRASRRRPAPTPSATASGSTSAGPTVRRIPSTTRRSTPGRPDRGARHEHPGGGPSTAPPPASSACACFRTRRSTRRRASKWGREALLRGRELLRLQGPRETLPGRDVVRLLPRRPEPDQPAGRP
jgi:hypothetical protein